MKPSDRSLDIAVIGLGQGGGNIAAEFARRGYRAMALNTARTDLSALGAANHPALSEAQRLYIGIDGYDGAGADLNYGRQCVMESAERIREVVARHTEGADVVLLAAGLGGGTGSAVSELIRVLESLDLPLTTIATLPGAQESGIAKVNAVRAVSELVKIPDLGLIFADNARLAELHGKLTLDEYFERINEIIVEPLDAFNRLNQRPGLHPIRTLDGEDLRTLLMSSGVLNYAEGLLHGLSVEGVTRWVETSLESSGVMPSGFDMGDIAYLGLVVEASSDLLATTPFTFFNEVGEQLKAGTSGAGIYMGVYSNGQMPSHTATVRMMASTPTLPRGIQTVVSAAQREGSTLREKLSRGVANLDLGDIADFDLLPLRSSSAPPSAGGKRRSLRPGRRVQVGATVSQLEAPAFGHATPQRSAEPSRRSEPVAAHRSEPVAAQRPEPVSAYRSEPLAAQRPEPVSAYRSEPLAAQRPEPVPAYRSEPLAAQRPEPVSAYRSEPLAAQRPEPVPAYRSEPVPTYRSEPVPVGRPEPAPRSEPVPRLVPHERQNSEPVLRPVGVDPFSRGGLRAAPPIQGRPFAVPAPAAQSVDEQPDPTADAGDRSEPETYDRLVDAFLNTDSEAIRRRIATRLHSSRNSDHPLARFYANRAIERLVDAGEEQALENVMSQIGAE